MNIPDSKLLTIYNNMVARLNAEYPKRFFMWLGVFHKDMVKELSKSDNDINDIWQRCVEGKATLLAFIGGVKIYEQIMLRGYDLYNTTQRKL